MLIAAVCLLLAFVFTQVATDVREGDLTEIDRAIRQFMITHQSATGVALLRVITVLAAKEILVPISILIGWWLSGRGLAAVSLLALCGLVSAEFVDLLKLEFHVDRPLAEMRGSRSFSFPSGHVSGAAAIAMLLSYVAWKRKRGVVATPLVGAVFVVLTAVSRLYLDRHWASDVFGGALIGLPIGLAFCALLELWTRHGARPVAGART